eukprot:TRINITY_DN7242_c0_g1_i4.p2 TRINITY_DN7242_c0_g1~~TRINITY_DN7242_c0_g1_i4.p2  ORF type:complete len:168 (-),score=15.68 TRINITY_DN7242_c0_g1_i4:1536-2039(-)
MFSQYVVQKQQPFVRSKKGDKLKIQNQVRQMLLPRMPHKTKLLRFPLSNFIDDSQIKQLAKSINMSTTNINTRNVRVNSLKQQHFATRPVRQSVQTQVEQPMQNFRQSEESASKNNIQQVKENKVETTRLVCPKAPLKNYTLAEKIVAHVFMGIASIKGFGSIKHPM